LKVSDKHSRDEQQLSGQLEARAALRQQLCRPQQRGDEHVGELAAVMLE